MRLPDWEERFNELVAWSAWKPFQWGKFDCCTFAADAVVAVRGDDPLGELRGSYSSLKSAFRLITELGGIEDATTRLLGQTMENPRFAKRGDIALVNGDNYPALAVVVGQAALAPLSIGLQRIPVADWLAAWKVD
jgi:hypothetical protein